MFKSEFEANAQGFTCKALQSKAKQAKAKSFGLFHIMAAAGILGAVSVALSVLM